MERTGYIDGCFWANRSTSGIGRRGSGIGHPDSIVRVDRGNRLANVVNLQVRRINHLPPLSWSLSIARGASVADLTCGPWVETGSNWFVEGAWDSEFRARCFEQSSLLMGSGGKVTEDRMVIATACHNLEPLFLASTDRGLTASNTLAFLLVTSGLSLDPDYSYYKTDLLSSRHGLDRYVKTIPTATGPDIHVLYYKNVVVDRHLTVTDQPKPSVPDWASFHEYRQFLIEGLRSLRDNARCPARQVHYNLLATLSSGYDSPASSVLASEIGAQDAVTVREGIDERSHQRTDDCGTSIAEELGLRVTEYPLKDMTAISDEIRAEFAAGGDATELNLISIEPHLPRKLLITGNSGVFWRLDLRRDASLSRADLGGSGLSEFRLRAGFIQVPVPMMGGVRRSRLNAIGRSAEMKPWSVLGSYNRPVPRRILEEKGIPRGQFARKKIGGPIVA